MHFPNFDEYMRQRNKMRFKSCVTNIERCAFQYWSNFSPEKCTIVLAQILLVHLIFKKKTVLSNWGFSIAIMVFALLLLALNLFCLIFVISSLLFFRDCSLYLSLFLDRYRLFLLSPLKDLKIVNYCCPRAITLW